MSFRVRAFFLLLQFRWSFAFSFKSRPKGRWEKLDADGRSPGNRKVRCTIKHEKSDTLPPRTCFHTFLRLFRRGVSKSVWWGSVEASLAKRTFFRKSKVRPPPSFRTHPPWCGRRLGDPSAGGTPKIYKWIFAPPPRRDATSLQLARKIENKQQIKKATLLRYKHQNYQVVHQGTWLVAMYLKIATELLVLSLVAKKRIPLC